MWPGFEKFNAKLDNNSSQHETIDHISTIAGSLVSLETEHTESPVSSTSEIKVKRHTHSTADFYAFFSVACSELISAINGFVPLFDRFFCITRTHMQGLDDRVYDTDHTDLNSDFDESELRRELLEDVSST